MEPTIHVGDRIVVDKSAYSIFLPFTDIEVKKTAEIARGDIVIINSSAANKRLVKRVVGSAAVLKTVFVVVLLQYTSQSGIRKSKT